MTRRNAFTAALAAPIATAAAAAAKFRKPAKQAAAPVTQAELQEVIDLSNRAERLAFSIRARLEAGATMERGALGVSTMGLESLEEEARNAGSWNGFVGGGVYIQPVETLAYQAERPSRPERHEMVVL